MTIDAKAIVRRTLTELKGLLAQEAVPRLSEADTKANFIEPIIAALGWSGIGVVTREYYVRNSQEFMDYVMIDPTSPPGRAHPLLAIEAKALQADLTEKNAAQLIQYCAVDGIEWAALTNGRELQFFNTFLKPDLAAKRIMRLDLLAFNSDEEFDTLFEHVWQLSRASMTTEVTRTWLNQLRLDNAVREAVTNPASATIRQLRKDLADADVRVSPQELVQWFRTHLGAPIARVHRNRSASELDGDKDAAPTPPSLQRRHDALYAALRTAVEARIPDVTWHSTKFYDAARSAGRPFLWIKFPTRGITLEERDPEQPSRGRTFATIHDSAQINSQILDQVEASYRRAPSIVTKTHHGITLQDLVSAGVLSPGTPLVFTSGYRDLAKATVTELGEILWEGNTYRVPSNRAFARLLGPDRESFNGWTHWVAELPQGRVSLADLRGRLMGMAERDDHPNAQAN